jgi:glucose/arabinose dehydrogenase
MALHPPHPQTRLRSRRLMVGAVATVAAMMTATAAPSLVAAAPQPQMPPRAEALPFGFSEVAVGSAASPTTVKALPNGTVAVLEKAGSVRIVRNGALLPTPALTLTVCSTSERGMLGIAPGNDFGATGYVYLYYTRVDASADGGCVNRVSRFTMTSDVIDPGSERVLVDKISSNNGNHNGGDVEMGKDGFLYISVGDAGKDPRGLAPAPGGSGTAGGNDAARDLSLLNGKILRVDPTTGLAAPGNPYSGAGTADCRIRGNDASTPLTTCREIFASGLRNPWRFAFDPNAAGVRFFINDVGQSTREEVDLGTLGADYGWNVREGQCPQGQNPPCPGPSVGVTDPITDYGRTVGTYVTGGAFIPNGTWPSQFDGAYFFSDGGSGRFWVRSAAGDVNYEAPFHTAIGVADMDFVREPSGLALYFVVAGTTSNSIRKITFPTQEIPTPSAPLRYVPTLPSDRVFDSRLSAFGSAPVTANAVRIVPVGVDGAVTKAVLVNIAYVKPVDDGFLRAWAAGGVMPITSNINALAGEVVANAAVVPVDGAGRINIFTNTNADVVIDVLGRFDLAGGSVAAGRLVPLPPERLIDTRNPASPSNAYVESGAVPINVVNATVRGHVGVPATGVSAVVLTVTAIAGTSVGGGYVTVSPGATAQPPTSNLNTNDPGDIRPNLVVVPLGADGSLDLHLFRVDDVVIDVTGYFTDATAAVSTTGRFRSITPYRETDTRTPFGFDRFDSPTTRSLDPVAVPSNAIAVAHNMTLVNNTAALFLTAFPSEPRPFISSANASGPNQLRATSAFTPLAGGSLRYYSMAATDLVVDVTGYFES